MKNLTEDYTGPMILFLDIEIMRDYDAIIDRLDYMYYKQQVMKADMSILTVFGYRWFHEDETKFLSLDQYDSEESFIKAVYEVLSQADIMIAHFGDRFDKKYLQSKMLITLDKGLQHLKSVDTCRIAKQYLYLASNSLKGLAKTLGVKCKTELPWSYWQQMEQYQYFFIPGQEHKGKYDRKLWDDMIEYCINDVDVLYECTMRLSPYIPSTAALSIALFDKGNLKQKDNKYICHNINCKGRALKKHSTRSVLTTNCFYNRYQCLKCGTVYRSNIKSKNNPNCARKVK